MCHRRDEARGQHTPARPSMLHPQKRPSIVSKETTSRPARPCMLERVSHAVMAAPLACPQVSLNTNKPPPFVNHSLCLL